MREKVRAIKKTFFQIQEEGIIMQKGDRDIWKQKGRERKKKE